MAYLIAQFWLCFLVAGVLGGIIGWLWRGGRARRDLAELEHRSRTALDEARADWSAKLEDTKVRLGEEVAAGESALAVVQEKLADRDKAHGELEAKLKETASNLEATEKRLADRDKAHGDLEAKLKETASNLKTTDKKLAARTERVEDLEPLVATVAEQKAHLREAAEKHAAETGAKDEEIRSLESRIRDLEPLTKQLAAKERELRKQHEDHARVVGLKDTEAERLRNRLAELEALPGQIESRDRSLREAEQRYQSDMQSRNVEIERLRDRLAQSEAAVKASPPKPPVPTREPVAHVAPSAAPPRRKDDLKRIKGIGKVLERLLNGLGYTTFRDISAWGPAEIETVSRKLDVFQGRIERDGWVNQARGLHQQDYGTGQ